MVIRIVAWLVTLLVLLLKATCRIHFHDDPREELRRQGQRYLFSFLHAHQLAVIVGSEGGTAAMVSRSRDGDLIATALQRIGLVIYRGSKKRERRDRGGQQALDGMIEHVKGGAPAALAIDGPRGPRGRVHKGVAQISQQTGAAVLNLVAIPRVRWIAWGAWDRMQVPLPFVRIDGYFAAPIYPREGEKLEAYRQRIEHSLRALEARLDPDEARFNSPTVPAAEPAHREAGGSGEIAA